MNTATTGVARADAGVASATVNTMQQIGGSIGTALLSTIFADVVKDSLSGLSAAPTKLQQAQAVIDGYHVAFGISAGVLVLVALAGGLLINRQSVRLAKLERAASATTGSIPQRRTSRPAPRPEPLRSAPGPPPVRPALLCPRSATSHASIDAWDVASPGLAEGTTDPGRSGAHGFGTPRGRDGGVAHCVGPPAAHQWPRLP